MKRILFHQLDWIALQQEYDAGYSIQTVCKKFAMSPKSIVKAVAAGLFKSRTPSEGAVSGHKMYPREFAEVRATRTALTNYRADCSFKFNLGSFPAEFDFTLIARHGWYTAKNHGNNADGISRDHMVSVRYGFDNNIDPKIISHPANCMLMQHRANASKLMKCSIELPDLLNKIEAWGKKYPS